MMNKLAIRTAVEDDLEAISQFLIKDFSTRERLHCSIAADVPFTARSNETLRKWLCEGNSLIAVDPDSNDTVAGIAVNYLLRRGEQEQNPTDYSQMPKRRRIITSFLNELEKNHNIFQEFNSDIGLELCGLGVKEEYSRQGLATKLTLETIKLAEKLGLGFIQSSPTAAETMHIFEKLGFQTKTELKLADYHLDGEPAFPRAYPTAVARFVVKKV